MAGTPLPVRPPSTAVGADADDRPTARGLVLLGVAALYAGACAMWALFLSRQALLLIYLSALLAVGLAPIVRLLERRGVGWRPRPLPRAAAVGIVYALGTAVGAAVLVSVLPTLV